MRYRIKADRGHPYYFNRDNDELALAFYNSFWAMQETFPESERIPLCLERVEFVNSEEKLTQIADARSERCA